MEHLAIPELWKAYGILFFMICFFLMLIKNIELVKRKDKVEKENLDLKRRLGRI